MSCRESESASPQSARPFATVEERSTTDHLIRLVQQHHVQLSAMADTKANIIITVSSIVLTLALGRAADADYRLAMAVLGVFTLVALLLAILAVLPKYRPVPVGEEPLPPHFNLLFFGHFAALPRERYLAEIARVLTPDGTPYATWAADVYALGVYLAQHKYRYLRWSYLFFLTGFVLASVEQLVRHLAR